MKKNLLKIPPLILERIQAFDQDDVVAACAKLIPPNEIARYAHLGISIENGALKLPAPALPPGNAGRYSTANRFGYDKKRTDLPKVRKTFSFLSPNYGDWSKGSHVVSHDREVYQVDFYPPKEVTLSVSLVERRGENYVLRFKIDQTINRRTPNFEKELLYNLNLLQENVGATDVFPSEATLAEYAATVRVDWQILPPGKVGEIMAAMLKGKPPITPDEARVMEERLTTLNKLKPEAFITGTDGFLRYFGAKFGEDFVAFENVRYGNAIYLMFDDWKEVSQRSRVDLLAGARDRFLRIEHRGEWKEQLEAQVDYYRQQKRKQARKLL
jgi:hypothetical protein